MSSRSNRARPAFTLGAAAVLVVSALAIGAGTPPARAVAQSDAKAKNDRSRRVCRIITPTSSRLVQRVCRPQHEWDEETKNAQDSFLGHNINQTRNGNRPGFVGGDPR